MIRKSIVLVTLIMAFAAADAQQGMKPDFNSPTGLQIHWLTVGEGESPLPGDQISVHYTGWLTDSTKFDSSRDRGTPFSFKLGKGQVIQGWDEAFARLRVGDRAVLTIPASIAYGAQERGQIPANATLIFDVELLSFVPGIRPFQVEGLDTMMTKEGVAIIFTHRTQGTKALAGQKVKVHYSGYFTDGSMFDSSVDRGQPFEFVLGKGMVIPGFDLAFQNLAIGDSARIIIPYLLAYGEAGTQGIPAKSDLVFDVTLLGAETIITQGPFDVTGKDTLTTASGLKYIKINQTQGALAEKGKNVKVHYAGYLLDGSKFDSSFDRGTPIEFVLGSGRVIPGWEEGISLLHYGEKARMIIPYTLAYGEEGRPPVIPPKAVLIFDVYLIEP